MRSGSSGSSRPTAGLTITLGRRLRRGLLLGMVLIPLAGCGRPFVSPILPGPHRETFEASYDTVWQTMIRVFARENIPVKAIARDSGVLASDDLPTTIGLYADCGRIGESPVEGQALVNFTIFVQAMDGNRTQVQINTKMRTELYGWWAIFGGGVQPRQPLTCSSTGRWEADLLDWIRQALPR